MKILICLVIFSAIIYSAQSQQSEFLIDTSKINLDVINYPDSSKCYLYFTDSAANYFCTECFYKNGFRSSLQFYYFGKKNGTSIAWFKNGHMQSIENYLMGCPAGPTIRWYENGQLKESGNFYVEANDSLIELNWFYKTERNIDPSSYSEIIGISSGYIGIKNGIWKYYLENGKLMKMEMWNIGKLNWEK